MILCYNRGENSSFLAPFPLFRTVAAVRNFYDRLSHSTAGLSTSYKKKPINIPVTLTLYATDHHHAALPCGVGDIVSYIKIFFTEEKQMTSKETLLALLDSLTPEDITLMLSLLETRREEARPVPPSCSQSLL